MATYNSIGATYADTRRPAPRIAARINQALGGVATVSNVGAGTGSYEPSHVDRLGANVNDGPASGGVHATSFPANFAAAMTWDRQGLGDVPQTAPVGANAYRAMKPTYGGERISVVPVTRHPRS